MTFSSQVLPSDNQKDRMPTKAKNLCIIVNLRKGRVTKNGLISSTLFCLPCDLPCSTLLQSCNLPILVQVHKICPWKRSKDVHFISCRARYTCSDGCVRKVAPVENINYFFSSFSKRQIICKTGHLLNAKHSIFKGTNSNQWINQISKFSLITVKTTY